MRLWHYKLIPHLPRSQLLAQWRELNSIFVNRPNHILINYAYNDKESLLNYTRLVIDEMEKRNYKISEKSYQHFLDYFYQSDNFDYNLNYKSDKMFKEHNDEYLEICYWNLREKYIRGQKDFTEEQMKGIGNILKGENYD